MMLGHLVLGRGVAVRFSTRRSCCSPAAAGSSSRTYRPSSAISIAIDLNCAMPGFNLFYMGINLGALISPLSVAWFRAHYGWSVAFGSAAVAMLLSLATFILGRRSLGDAADRVAPDAREVAAVSPGDASSRVHILLVVFVLSPSSGSPSTRTVSRSPSGHATTRSPRLRRRASSRSSRSASSSSRQAWSPCGHGWADAASSRRRP